MKKCTFLLLTFYFSLFTFNFSQAQKSATMLIYKAGQVTNIINLTDVDSIAFTPCYSNCGKVKDYDGNLYNTVIIGTQCWLQKNLNTTHYSNGAPIPNVKDSTQWWNLTTGAYCNYNNDTNIAKIYGRMYNWYAVADTNKICPAGWHVPADSEWTKLVKYLGDSNVAGGKMKEAGTSHWISPNIATNSSGLTLLPAGYRDNYTFLDFDYIGWYTGLWSSTKKDIIHVWGTDLGYDDASTYRGWSDKEAGLNVRCVKN